MSIAGSGNAGITKPKRSVGKIIGIVLGCLAAFVAAIVALVMWLTGDIADMGKDFLAKLRTGDIRAAYELTTPGFQSGTGFDRFQTYVRQQGFDKAEPSGWSNRSLEGSGDNARGTLRGVLKVAGGEARPLEIKLARIEGKWRIQYVDVGPVGASSVASTESGLKIPDERELIRLTHEANMVFARSIRGKSLKPFHDFVSERFRAKFNVADMDKAFAVFIEKEMNLVAIEPLTPRFAAPAKFDDKDSFKISGAYETRPSRMTFDHTYAYEGLGWKLIAYNINVKPVETPAADGGKP